MTQGALHFVKKMETGASDAFKIGLPAGSLHFQPLFLLLLWNELLFLSHIHVTSTLMWCPTVMLFISPIPAIPAVMLVVSLRLRACICSGPVVLAQVALLTLICGHPHPAIYSATHWAPSGAAHLGASFPLSLASWVSGPGLALLAYALRTITLPSLPKSCCIVFLFLRSSWPHKKWILTK